MMDKAKREQLRAAMSEECPDVGRGYAQEFLTLLDMYDELEAERDSLSQTLLAVKSLHFESHFDGKEQRWHGDVDFGGALKDFYAAMIYTHFVENGGVNYVEWTISHPPTNEAFTVLIQKRFAQTPAEVNAHLRAELARLREQVNERDRALSQQETYPAQEGAGALTVLQYLKNAFDAVGIAYVVRIFGEYTYLRLISDRQRIWTPVQWEDMPKEEFLSGSYFEIDADGLIAGWN